MAFQKRSPLIEVTNRYVSFLRNDLLWRENYDRPKQIEHQVFVADQSKPFVLNPISDKSEGPTFTKYE